jgi:hypothetical protein
MAMTAAEINTSASFTYNQSCSVIMLKTLLKSCTFFFYSRIRIHFFAKSLPKLLRFQIFNSSLQDIGVVLFFCAKLSSGAYT